jgi:hypothetical protein
MTCSTLRGNVLRWPASASRVRKGDLDAVHEKYTRQLETVLFDQRSPTPETQSAPAFREHPTSANGAWCAFTRQGAQVRSLHRPLQVPSFGACSCLGPARLPEGRTSRGQRSSSSIFCSFQRNRSGRWRSSSMLREPWSSAGCATFVQHEPRRSPLTRLEAGSAVVSGRCYAEGNGPARAVVGPLVCDDREGAGGVLGTAAAVAGLARRRVMTGPSARRIRSAHHRAGSARFLSSALKAEHVPSDPFDPYGRMPSA